MVSGIHRFKETVAKAVGVQQRRGYRAAFLWGNPQMSDPAQRGKDSRHEGTNVGEFTGARCREWGWVNYNDLIATSLES